MKRVVFFISLFWVIIANAQNDQSSSFITINPQGSDEMKKKVKYGERIKFKILNVNTFKINGYVTCKPVNIDFTVPAIFNDLTTQIKAESLLSQGEKNELVETFNPDNKDRKKADKEKFQQLIKLLDKEESIVQKQNEFKKTFSEFLKTYQRINLYTCLEDNLYRKLSDSIFIRDTAILKKNCESQYLAFFNNPKDLKTAKENVTKDLSEIDSQFTSLKLLYEELLDMQKQDTIIMNGSLQTSDKKNSISIKNAIVILDKKKYFENEFSYAKKIFDQLNDSKNRIAIIEKAHSGIDLYNKIANESFIVYTESEAVYSDEVTLTPVLKYSNGNIAKEFNPYHMRTSGGIKVNFSSGYLLSFKGDDNYSLYRDSIGNIKGVSSGNTNSLTHSIGALAHVYLRSAIDFNFALSSGISIANNGSLGFYLGGSFLFFEKNRLIISSGISYIQRQQLNKANLVNVGENNYKFLSATDNSIKYDQVYKPAFFVGVTYNISGNK